MSNGQFVKMGTKWGTTFPETGDAMYDLIDVFYNTQYNFAKSGGAATYGDNGYFNAIMGKEITATMFSSDNIFTALGARPYQHEGVRLATELATYGLDANGDFVGAGAFEVQDGNIGESFSMPVGEYREPWKQISFPFDYGLGLMAVENKDDTIAYKDYMDKMSANFSDLIDKTLLRPLYTKQPTLNGVETSINGIERAISSADEIGKSYGGVTIDNGMVCPYGGMNGDFHVKADDPVNFANLSGQVIDLEQGNLQINDVRNLLMMCRGNWKGNGSANNKMWAMGTVMLNKLGALMMANNLYLDSVYVTRDFNGVKSYPGRDIGFTVKSFEDIPIIVDGNINFDFAKKKIDVAKAGTIFLNDLDHMWMSVLTPVELYNINNVAITRMARERNVMLTRMELRTDSYIQSGRIVNIGTEA